ncbi:MAG: carboxymuconolactone decarboxylase family protein [Petrotogales bacterium]
MKKVEQFKEFRKKLNEKIHEYGNVETKRFFALDSAVYKDGSLDKKTKELLGLVSSMVLRCDDCVTYHLVQCKKMDTTLDEFIEAFNIALIVGGSIVIPHLRNAVSTLEELNEKEGKENGE